MFFLSAELTSDATLKNEFQTMSLEAFWIKVYNEMSEYNELSQHALRLLLNFTSTYLCETSFSAMAHMKNKQRSRLNAEIAMRVAISNIEPRIEQLAKSVKTNEEI